MFLSGIARGRDGMEANLFSMRRTLPERLHMSSEVNAGKLRICSGKMRLYVWYSPRLDRLYTLPIHECRKYSACRWDKCAYIRIIKTKPLIAAAILYIGEL